MITKEQLATSTIATARLMGLLKPVGNDYQVDETWFDNPVKALQGADTRLDQLVALLHQVLSSTLPDPLPEPAFEKATWLALPLDGGNWQYAVVVPAKKESTEEGDKKSGEIGFGLRHTDQEQKGYSFCAYLPLFSFGEGGAQFLLSRDTGKIQLVLTKPGLVKKVTDSGVRLRAAICPASPAQSTAELAFVSANGTVQGQPYTNIEALRSSEVVEKLKNMLAQATDWLATPLAGGSLTPGALLAGAGFITPTTANDKGWNLNLDGLTSTPPEQIALNLVRTGLTKLAAAQQPLLKLAYGSLSVVGPSQPGGPPSYGLRLRLNLPLNKGKQTPLVTLVVGEWLSGEGEDKHPDWMQRSTGMKLPESGLTLSLLHLDKENQPSFTPAMALSSAGINISGQATKPLLDLRGYTLQAAELRASVGVPHPTTGQPLRGFAAKLTEVGLPLAPSLGDSGTKPEPGKGNPVVQSLLQADTTAPAAGKGEGESAGDQAPVNPTFGAAVAWVQGYTFNVQLFDDQNTPAEQVLLPINRALGPLFCQRLGVGWMHEQKRLGLLFDGSVRVGPLAVALQGLKVGLPLTAPTDLAKYDLDLEGLGVEFAASDVKLHAALLKVPASEDIPYPEYQGTATLEAKTFSLSTLGSYAWLAADPLAGESEDYTSLFIFGAYLAALGGPAFFFVTGIAAGFGYNRALLLPEPDKVVDFPLLQLLDPKALRDTTTQVGTQQLPSPQKVLEKLRKVVPPQRGQYWLAAGVRFTSFDLVHTTALLSVAFGKELKIGVTGISWLSLPPPPKAGSEAPSTRFAYVEMGVAIEILPAEGVVTATAVLTPNSYVIDPACQLTGVFAFYTWFGNNNHAGDFVLTVGGYHPLYTPPAHYPRVPRLGFRWPVSANVSISGDAYFALTPNAIMVGGGLQVLFNSGDLRAWFTAQMDALVRWAPFQYDLAIAVSIGASYRLNLLFVTVTLKVELGASLQLWGPRMGGQAHISWAIISFTIGFGADRPAKQNVLAWVDAEGQGFSQTLLPHSSDQAHYLATSGAPRPDTAKNDILLFSVLSGLRRTVEDKSGVSKWVVHPGDFSFSALTSFPLTKAVAPGGTEYTPNEAAYGVWIRPMDVTVASSVLTATITKRKGQYEPNGGQALEELFALTPSYVAVPAAKWGDPGLVDKQNDKPLLPGRLMGFAAIRLKQPQLLPTGEQALNINIATAFRPEVVNENDKNHLPLAPQLQPSGPVPTARDEAWQVLKASLANEQVAKVRDKVYLTLVEEFGLDPGPNQAVTQLGATASRWLKGQPIIAPTAAANFPHHA